MDGWRCRIDIVIDGKVDVCVCGCVCGVTGLDMYFWYVNRNICMCTYIYIYIHEMIPGSEYCMLHVYLLNMSYPLDI